MHLLTNDIITGDKSVKTLSMTQPHSYGVTQALMELAGHDQLGQLPETPSVLFEDPPPPHKGAIVNSRGYVPVHLRENNASASSSSIPQTETVVLPPPEVVEKSIKEVLAEEMERREEEGIHGVALALP